MKHQRALKDMIRHRRDYWTAMDALLALQGHAGGLTASVDITNHHRVFMILELLDIGYCDPEAIVVLKQFGRIQSVVYRGGDPLTELGHRCYDERGTVARLAAALRRLFAR